MRYVFLLAICFSHCGLVGQTYLVTTIAGYLDDWGDGAPATQARFSAITALTTDIAGNVYLADTGRVHKIGLDAGTGTIAGFGLAGNSGDLGPAVLAKTSPNDIAVDPAGILYIAESQSPRIRKVQADGTIVTVAFPVQSGSSEYIAVNASGELFISDSGTIRKLTPDGTITTVVTLQHGTAGVTVDRSGNLFVVLPGLQQVWKIDASGNQTVVAGGGTKVEDGVPATQSALNSPTRVAIDRSGNLYIGSLPIFANGIRKVDTNGIITTIGGSSTTGPLLCCLVATDSSGALYTISADYMDPNRVWRITPDGVAHSFAGGGIGDGGPAIRALLSGALGLARDDAGNLYVADSGNNRVRKIDPRGVITTIAGAGASGFGGDGGQANQAMLNGPRGVVLDVRGDIYVADTLNNRIRKIDRAGIISTVAGTGVAGYTGEGIQATASALKNPVTVRFDQRGNLYIVDTGNQRVRIVTDKGIMSTVAGNGIDLGCCGFPEKVPIGDGGPATQAILHEPSGIAFDPAGNLYITEAYGGRIRKVTPAGLISTAFDNLGLPGAITRDAQGNFYITEYTSILKVSPDGTITRLAGTDETIGNDAFGVPSPESVIGFANDLILDASGNVLFTDDPYYPSYVRKLEPANIFPARAFNQASLKAYSLSPGEIVSIYWVDLGPTEAATAVPGADGRFPAILAGTRALFNGIAAPVLQVDQRHVTAVVPYALAGLPATSLQLEYMGKRSNSIGLPLQPALPGLFTVAGGTGPAAALNQDSTVNSPSHPAGKGSVVMLFATGAGAMSPAVPDGTVARDPLSTPVHPVFVQIGGVDADVTYAGAAPGLIAGVLQVNARVPKSVQSGNVPVKLTIDGAESQEGVTVVVE